MPVCLRDPYLVLQCLTLLGGGSNAQTVIVENLQRPPFADVEIGDQVASRHLVELDARQFPQGLATLPAQALGIPDGRAQGAVELALLAVQLGDSALER